VTDRQTRVNRLLIAVALVAGLVLSPSTSASATAASTSEKPPPGVGIRLVDAPVATAGDPRGRVYIIDHVAPGSVIERRVEVSNGTDSTKQIAVYPAAAEIRGDAFTGARGRTQNELSRWVTVRPTEPVLAPDERAMVDLAIDVPGDASRGERYGVVWAEMTTPAQDGGVTQVSRVGVRIYLSVGPGGAPVSDFEVTSLTPARTDDGIPLVQATVLNTGRRALDFTGKLRLDDGPGGLSAGPFEADLGTTLGIGDTAPVSVLLDEALPNGPWRAHLTVTSGLEKRTAEATITFPETVGTAPAVPVEDSDGTPGWLIGGGLALLLLLAGLMVILASRRRREPVEAWPGVHSERRDDVRA